MKCELDLDLSCGVNVLFESTINLCSRSRSSVFSLQHLESYGTLFTLMKSCFEKFQLFSFSSMLIQVKGIAEFVESVPTQFRVLRVIVGVLILNKGGSAGYLHRVSLALYGPGVCQKLL